MAITYFGSASTPADNGSNTTGPAVITPPASMVQGDLVIVECSEDSAGKTASITDAGGQTWTSETNMNTVNSTRLFWCTYNGTWSSNPSFTASGALTVLTAVMHVFRGAGTGSTWSADSTFASTDRAGVSSPVTITGLTTTGANVVVLAAWQGRTALSWSSLSGSGWTVTGSSQYRNTGGSDLSSAFAHYIASVASTVVPNVSNTASGTLIGFTYRMSFADSGGGGGGGGSAARSFGSVCG